MAELPAYPGTPRWVKVSAAVIGILVLTVLAMIVAGVGGPHGPGRHYQSDDAGGGAPPSRMQQP
jgi:hypothetical protein